MAAFGFAASALTGFRTMVIMRNPLFASTSVSDFWGRRWNLLISGVLKVS